MVKQSIGHQLLAPLLVLHLQAFRLVLAGVMAVTSFHPTQEIPEIHGEIYLFKEKKTCWYD